LKNTKLRGLALPALTALILAMGMSAANAARIGDSYLFQWDDSPGHLFANTYKNGDLIQSVDVGANGYNAHYGLWAGTLVDAVDFDFNGYIAGSGDIGVTWRIAGNAGDQSLVFPFHSDYEPGPLVALPSPDLQLTISGDWQTVLEFDVSNGDHYTWEFRSQVVAVPEPETYALMLGGLGVLAWVARRRKA